jgi:hypothetical protein
MSKNALIALVLLTTPWLAPGQNLISDPSFELGSFSDPGCQMQGLMVDTWFNATNVVPGPDCWTFNCAQKPGTTVGPPYPAHWAGVGGAHTGLRVAAGWSNTALAFVEAYGTQLTAALTPGAQYRLSAYFVRSAFHPSSGGLNVYLSSAAGVGGCAVGTIGTNATTATAWTADCLEFTAPAGCGNMLILEPFGVDSYLGTDDWVLTAVGPLVSMSQPGGAGSGLILMETGLLAGHEYFTAGTLDEPCPGGVGTGPYLGLCTADVSGLIAQVLSPLGTPPFHYLAPACSLTFGPVGLPPGIVLQVICFDLTGGVLGAVSPVSSYVVL